MEIRDSPEGYTEYLEHKFPNWLKISAILSLLLIAAGVIYLAPVTIVRGYPNTTSFLSFVIGGVFSLFIHESLHYVTASWFEYDPVYVWPSKVYVPEESLPVKHILPMLLSPQVLSLTYLGLLLIGMNTTLELIIGWGLFLNIQGAWADVLWSVRRLTWPTGTKVIVGEDHSTYVAFPEEPA